MLAAVLLLLLLCCCCRAAFPKLQKLEINCPIKQLVFGTRGSYRCMLVEQKPLTAYEFRWGSSSNGAAATMCQQCLQFLGSVCQQCKQLWGSSVSGSMISTGLV
jgi:hypothetical protein